MVMALVGVTKNYGIHEGWIIKCIKTWLTMFPIAYVAALIIIPIANKLTDRIKYIE